MSRRLGVTIQAAGSESRSMLMILVETSSLDLQLLRPAVDCTFQESEAGCGTNRKSEQSPVTNSCEKREILG